MATHPPPSPSGADPDPDLDRIRSLQDADAIFHAFDAYPWTKDETFLSGLSAILGPPTPDTSPSETATRARIFYYAHRIGVRIDLPKYTTWLSRNPDHAPPRVLPPEYLPPTSPEPPATAEPSLPWQRAAPKADLYVDRRAAAAAAAEAAAAPQTSRSGPADPGQPSYPMAFADMLKFLQEGKEIPGIRQIPNTIARDASVKPVGARAAPRKPWEKEITHLPPDLNLPKALDTDFPPLDTDPIEPLSPTKTLTP